MLKEYSFKKRAMGTDLVVSVVAGSDPREDLELVERMFEYYERRFSRFDEESELSCLNRERKLVVSGVFLKVLGVARDYYYQSNGVFNPLCCPRNLGYDRDFEALKALGGRENCDGGAINMDFGAMEVDGNFVALKDGQYLDFGGFLKGYVAGMAAEFLKRYEGFYISIGGDIVTGGGSIRGDDFAFAVLDPRDMESYLDVLEVKDCAVATSGSYKRKWEVGGKEKHHILDSELGDSSKSDLVSVTVVAEDGGKADAFATVVMVLGREKGAEFLKAQGCGGVLVGNDYSLIRV